LSGPSTFNPTFPRSFGADDEDLDVLPAGSYTLTVAGQGSYKGAYAFSLMDQTTATAITAGTAVNSSLNPANTMQFFQFSGAAGELVSFTNTGFSTTDTSGNGGSTTWSLFDQYGQQLFTSGMQLGSTAQAVLGVTGPYLLVVQGNVGDNGTTAYSF